MEEEKDVCVACFVQSIDHGAFGYVVSRFNVIVLTQIKAFGKIRSKKALQTATSCRACVCGLSDLCGVCLCCV